MSDTIARPAAHNTITPEEIAAAAFLSAYSGYTRSLYTSDLRIFFTWCQRVGIRPLEAERPHIEFFLRYLEEERGNQPASVARRLNTIRSFYKICTSDGRIAKDPAVMVRSPRVEYDPARQLGLDRVQVGNLLHTARTVSPAHEALVALMALLSLRVSEACNVRIEDFAGHERGHRVLRLEGKGKKRATIPVPVPVQRILDRCADGRTDGYLILRASGEKQDRAGAYAWIRSLAKRAGLPAGVHPHTLRHAAVTAALDAGATLRDAQVFARHADPRTTERYDRTRFNLDRSPAYLVAGYIAGLG